MSSRCTIRRLHSLSPPLVTWPMAMVIILATRTPPAAAQVVTVAALSEVRGLTSGDACKALPTPGLRSALSRQRGRDTTPAWPTDSVLARDRLTVQPRTDVRVVVAQRLGSGTIYLTPDLGTCPSSQAALKDRGLPTPQGAASYRFDREAISGGGERMVLTVDHGSTIVEWSRGQLIVYAGARRLEVRGTRFVVIVDSNANTAAVYVLEGLVAMTTQGGLTAGPGQTIAFRPTGAARVPSPDDAFVDDIQHKSRTVWGAGTRSAGGWNTMRWVLGGAVVGGAALLITRSDGGGSSDPSRANARINIRIPY